MFQYNDQVSLSLLSGSGGNGCVSFCRTKTKPRGGPDGGDGGQGGSLFFLSSPKVSDFEHLRKIKRYQSDSGKNGGKNFKNGKKGKDLIINIPLGTLVCNEKGQILKDFTKPRTELFLEGGRGGRGNTFFKSSLNQAPRRFQKGEKAQWKRIILELKPLVQVAIIGKVNTGKSSFFNLVTKAQSKVASYPYTTLVPHIGKLKNFSAPCFIMDIPGLEKGASKSIFKGLSFLRSLQRADLLLHFIDSACERALEDKKEIEEEIKKFDKKCQDNHFIDLNKKKTFFVFSKRDQLENKTQYDALVKNLKLKPNQKVFFLSNKTKEGIKELCLAIEKAVVKKESKDEQ